jgi:hypothetical protein
MPDVVGAFRHANSFDFAAAVRIEQAQFDILRIGREQCEIGSAAIPSRT